MWVVSTDTWNQTARTRRFPFASPPFSSAPIASALDGDTSFLKCNYLCLPIVWGGKWGTLLLKSSECPLCGAARCGWHGSFQVWLGRSGGSEPSSSRPAPNQAQLFPFSQLLPSGPHFFFKKKGPPWTEKAFYPFLLKAWDPVLWGEEKWEI